MGIEVKARAVGGRREGMALGKLTERTRAASRILPPKPKRMDRLRPMASSVGLRERSRFDRARDGVRIVVDKIGVAGIGVVFGAIVGRAYWAKDWNNDRTNPRREPHFSAQVEAG